MEDEHILKRTFLSDEKQLGGQRRPQTSWVLDVGRSPLVTFIGKYETLAEDFEYIRKVTNINPLPEEKIRKSKRGDYREAYDDEMCDFVAYHFISDIQHFGYRFDE